MSARVFVRKLCRIPRQAAVGEYVVGLSSKMTFPLIICDSCERMQMESSKEIYLAKRKKSTRNRLLCQPFLLRSFFNKPLVTEESQEEAARRDGNIFDIWECG